MNEEERLELERLSVAHEFPPAKNCYIVYEDEDGRFLQRGYWSLSSNKPEVISRVADDSLEGLVEVGP